ncbi:hypothetical protein SAMN03159488_01992 [Pseudomonas sp. NFIX10]|nr:hypothetical protein SAMN03159488_01992 [Pseudomonas sp. NFIX10]SFE66531.1 hypothetical protein SAMN03159367_01785 [Pseudomonas sp. NFACC06-1]
MNTALLIIDAHSTVDNGSMAAEQIIANHNNRLGRLSSAVSRIDVMPAAEIRL